MNPAPVLSLESLTLRQRGRVVLNNLSLQLGSREILALVGPSGSGKTSVVRTLLGLLRPESGRVLVGHEVATDGSRIIMPPEERNLSVVFQDLALWPHLTVHGNLAFALASRKIRRTEREESIASMLRRVALTGLATRHPGELSGGECQRVAIARALVLEPRAVLLDEPLANLDVGLKRELLALFQDLFTERQVSAIFVTHDPREATALGNRLAVIESGRITQSGTLRELASAPATPFVESFVGELASARRTST